MVLRTICQGMKVCVETVLMAADAGLVARGEEVIAVSGTRRGADTAVVALASTSAALHDLHVTEIICKPLQTRSWGRGTSPYDVHGERGGRPKASAGDTPMPGRVRREPAGEHRAGDHGIRLLRPASATYRRARRDSARPVARRVGDHDRRSLERGCQTFVESARELGGRPEASILVHGDKVPAQQAAFVNAVMARALDFEDSIAPGAHPGAAVVSAALAAAELAGGVSGADFLAAIVVGTELAIRLNLGESEYDGFDPTGVCVPFGSTAAAARLLGLSEGETWNALALAFCRCGGSFQANVDGALAVRAIQGWASETGVTCARLAGAGITGPRDFLEGVYGYFHLFGRDRVGAEKVLPGLGTDYQVDRLVVQEVPELRRHSVDHETHARSRGGREARAR